MGWLWIALFGLIVGTSAHLTARHALRQPPGLPRGLAAAVLAWAGTTVGLQALGGVGLLGRPGLFAMAGLALAVAGGWRMRRPAPPDPPRVPGEGPGGAGVAALGLVILACLMIGVPSALAPPKIVSDGPIYHLFFAAKWWKAGRVFPVASPFGETAATYFPANGDLWFAGLMALYGGDRPARVGQAPFLLLAGAFVYAMARSFRARPSASLVASAWFATSLPLLLFAFEANVDAIFVAGYLGAVYFGLRYAREDGGRPALVLAGLSAGLAWGTKPTATAFVPPLLMILGVIVARRPTPRRSRLVDGLALGGATLLPCGSWFARGLILAGNPFYPMHVEALGRVWLRGWYRTSDMTRSQFYLPVSDGRSLVAIAFTVFDARLAPFWLAALLGAWRLGRGRAPGDRWLWGLAALAAANVATYWLAIPYRTQQRFMLQAVGLAAVPLAAWLDRSRWLAWAAAALLGVHLTTGQSWPAGGPGARAPWEVSERIPVVSEPLVKLPLDPRSWAGLAAIPGGPAYLAFMGGVTASAFGLAAVWARAARGGSGRWLAAAGASTLAVVLGYALAVDAEGRLSRKIYPQFPDYARAWAALESLSPREGTRVAYAGTNLPLMLMAGGLRNDVVYANVDEHRGWLLHDYHLSAGERGDPEVWEAPPDGPRDGARPGWDRLHPDYHAWLANLAALRVRLLVVARANPVEGRFLVADPEGFPIEKRWAEGHPESFTPVYPREGRDPEMRIFRVHPAGIRESATDRRAGRP